MDDFHFLIASIIKNDYSEECAKEYSLRKNPEEDKHAELSIDSFEHMNSLSDDLCLRHHVVT